MGPTPSFSAARAAVAASSPIFPVRERKPKLPDLREVEHGLRPVGGDQHAAHPLGGVAHADLVVDVRVRQRDVRDDEIREREALDHLRDDQRADVAVGAHGLVAHVGSTGR
jgi:hypothetical protein